jgi:hypothetical protein
MAKQRKKTRAKKQPMPEPKWRTVEKVVAMLEKSLLPESRVQHNVKLPNLRTGHPEQIDVLIETGSEPRIFRTIVEVQKRGKRVNVNDFRGWCKKMSEVAANRLICVSAEPFPISIKDMVAMELGPTVLLVRLQDLASNQWPIQIANNSLKLYKSAIELDKSIVPSFSFAIKNNPFSQRGLQLDAQDKVIRLESRDELVPVGDLLNEGMKVVENAVNMRRLSEGIHRVPHDWRPAGVSLCLDGMVGLIEVVRAFYRVEVRSVLFPVEFSSYTQEGHDSSLAWVAQASGMIDGELIQIRFALVPESSGGFGIRICEGSDLAKGGYLFWGAYA